MYGLETLLSPQAIALVICLASLGMAARAILSYNNAQIELLPAIQKLDAELEILRPKIGPLRDEIKDLIQKNTPLFQRQEMLRGYLAELDRIYMAYQREEAKKEAEEEANLLRRVERRPLDPED